eukprot:scaffold3571_cov176-Amphora_coffeaeformis.AAC.19
MATSSCLGRHAQCLYSFGVARRMFFRRSLASSTQCQHDNETVVQQSNVLDVSPLAEQMRTEVRNYTQKHKDVRLVGILASKGDFRQDAETYTRSVAKTFFEDGIDYELLRCPCGERSGVEQAIRAMNARTDVHGILVFYPIFTNSRANLPKTYLNKMNGTYYKTEDDYLRDLVLPSKDVEGLSHPYNARHLFRARAKSRQQNEMYIPCTALAVARILESFHQPSLRENGDWTGSVFTVINRSEILGRPLAAMLALHGASVYSVDEHSILEFQPQGRMRRCTGLDLEACLERSSVVVTGVPSPHFRLPAHAIQDNTTVVNVSTFSNIDETDFGDRPSVTLITQVGKVTVAALEHNLIRLHKQAMTRQQSVLDTN